ncbi:hypothetical protein PV325_009441, partial [Microctonus aethiopoides]
ICAIWFEEADFDCSASLQSFKDEKSAKKCFFCNKTIVKRKGRNIYCRQVKHKIPFLERCKTHATEQGRIDVLRKIQENKKCPDDSTIAYHNYFNMDDLPVPLTLEEVILLPTIPPHKLRWSDIIHKHFGDQPPAKILNFLNNKVNFQNSVLRILHLREH